MRRFIEQNLLAVFLLVLSLFMMAYAATTIRATTPSPGGDSPPAGVAGTVTATTETLAYVTTASSTDERENDEFVYTSVYKNEKIDTEQPATTTSVVSQNKNQVSQNVAPVEEHMILISLIVPGQRYDLTVPEGTTVLELLDIASEEYDFTYDARDYGAALGQLVTEINGQRENRRTGFYWIYYINGHWATEGISNVTLHTHDIIEWKYEKPPL